MTFNRYSLGWALSLGLLAACGQTKSGASKLDGHPEYIQDKYTAQTDKDKLLVSTPVAVPEYAPSSGVVISLTVLTSTGRHDMAKALLDSGIEHLYVMVPQIYAYRTAAESPDFKALAALGGDLSKVVLVPTKDSAKTTANLQDGTKYLTVWARDWSPQTAFTAEGQKVLLDFNYYSNRDADDSAARSLVELFNVDLPTDAIITDPNLVARVSVPVYNEGGNFMNNDDGHCLMTTRVSDANSQAAIDVAAEDNRRKNIFNDEVMDNAEISRQYKEKAGCKEVTILPRIPYEGTGHIDMWAKFLDNDTILVNEIRDEVVNLEWYTAEEKAKTIEIRDYLEARTRDIKALGFNVVRIPMPAPVFGYLAYFDDAQTQIVEFPDVFRSYTNSITVNGVAVTPQYAAIDADGYVYNATSGAILGSTELDQPYPDANLVQAYENEARAAYEAHGYRMSFVNSDNLIAIGGAIHCTTMQVAKNPNVL